VAELGVDGGDEHLDGEAGAGRPRAAVQLVTPTNGRACSVTFYHQNSSLVTISSALSLSIDIEVN
jgi:hypothetical protein